MQSPNENECFNVTWKIDNFIYCLFDDNMSFGTSIFKTEKDDGNVWWMLKVKNEIFPTPNSSLVFKLEKINGSSENDKCEMSISSPLGKIDLMPMTKERNDPNFYFTTQRDALFTKKGQSILPEVPMNTIIINCVISHEKIKTGQCSLFTVLHKVCTQMNLSSSDCAQIKLTKVYDLNNIQLVVKISKILLSTSDRTHSVVFKLLSSKSCWPSFVKSKLSILEGAYDNPQLIEIISCNTRVWKIEKYDEPEVGISLRIKCIVAIELQLSSKKSDSVFGIDLSSDVSYNLYPTHQEISYGATADLSNDLKMLYKTKIFTNAMLITQDKSFPAHKSILAARSPVFKAMFEGQNTTEGQSGTVAIDDLDSETVDRMLVYLYSDSLDEMEWEEASALYYAADKYDIFPLKQRCTSLLKNGLTETNVLDAVVLADRHTDEDLMRHAVEFIGRNRGVMASLKWERLEETHLQLTSRIMRQIFVKTN